jgi:hypothetical protein
MPARAVISCLLLVLLVFAGLHCICGHEITVDAQGVPHKHCHDESGCICKGATFVDPVTIEGPALVIDWLAIADEPIARHISFEFERPTPNYLAAPPPLSGKALRARIESLVI